ncbi:putative aaa atpase [Phaeomoniella chlamydospora]|uniref:Midasin n=1 Tax=Phaeomoniella chlamydospora TaxID=158046 RepID=A0A0G2EC70_PHACM|nr:putative aaa atpase [Phaeomoniella chlamydospora]
MENIAVYCSWADQQLTRNQLLLSRLPTELAARIQTQIDSRYLEALAAAFLIPQCTDDIFCLYEPLAVDAFARASLAGYSTSNGLVAVVTAFARILPFAPYLKPFLFTVLDSHKDGPLAYLSDTKSLKLADLEDESLISLLLALFRILSHDLDAFKHIASPIQLLSLFKHSSHVIRCLAVRCFSKYMRFADAKTESLLDKHLGDRPALGAWENREIDFRYVSLWEERRWYRLETTLGETRSLRSAQAVQNCHNFVAASFSPLIALIGDVLVPRQSGVVPQSSTLVPTSTTQGNLGRLASALLDTKPTLLVGYAGSGKTSIVNDAARKLGAATSMITLHLNEQTDAKSLLGIYTASAGTFKWQAGILTKAVREGRWVLIEDLDRAPQEVIGLLLPLIERGELLIPNRNEHIRAAQGFRLLATIRSQTNARGEGTSSYSSILGARLWKAVSIEMLQSEETESILRKKYPLLERQIPSILASFTRLCALTGSPAVTNGMRFRPVTIRDLLKWCTRINRRLRMLGVRSGQEAVPEDLGDHIFLDAIDCFVRSFSDIGIRSEIASIIGQELHLSPQRVEFILTERLPEVSETDNILKVGREVVKKGSNRPIRDSTFSWTRHASRLIETCAAGVQSSEPLLLVGETGIGKTTAIQYLAKKLGKKMTVINLSQQSESSDILGGFKPVTTRSLALPMVEEFNDLFDQTFSAKRNQKFLASISHCIKKQNYQRLVVLWEEAVKMAENNFGDKDTNGATQTAGKPAKRRKIEGTKYEVLQNKWSNFAVQLDSLRASISKQSNKFAFAFVEGKVIQALRNGDWVLLDEINLAAPDTLESILSLLNHGDDGPPTALLSESGQAEMVFGHKEFRIFAAMNPATDSGKRDLASGIRSRFTEIYVDSPDRDLADLLTLIETYVGDLTVSDKRLSSDLAYLYLAVQELNDRRQLTDGAGNLPHFSIRTLVRTLLYLRKHVGVYGLRRALYEGFSMSFLTMLSKESELGLIPVLDKYVLASQKNARSLLRQSPRPPTDGPEYVQFRHYWVPKGSVEPKREAQYIITPFVERNLLNLARAVSMRMFPILLQGPTSSGKTSMVEYLAKISGHKFVRINNHEHTDLQEYLGTYASDEEGRLRYQEGVLVRALREGHWVVLDELNLAPTDVLEALNRLLDDNRELFIPETQETVRPHPNFMLFATQNPAGVYGGRKHLSRAFRNRFLELHFDDIPEDELEFILKERAQIPPSFCAKIVAVYKKLSLMRQLSRLFEQRNSFATLRDLFRWALRKADDREQLAIHGFMLLAERVREPAEKLAVKQIIEEVMKVKINESQLYSPSAIPQSIVKPPSGIVWTFATRRLAVLIMKAIEHNEPVLLIGETGAGKTQVFQTISHMLGKSLSIVNAHVNLETGDLIGAQRPIRNRAAIEQQLREDLKNLMWSANSASDMPLDNLIRDFVTQKASSTLVGDSELIESIQANIVRRQALFEWADGSLVSAMKAGDHFLLDEIALADDSVLERLNSVLEPTRTIFLAEKGADKASVTAAADFQFFATMNPGGDYGKRELSAALRNRLTEIWVPSLTDEDIIPILQNRLGLSQRAMPEAMLHFAKWFKQSFSRSSETQVSLRELLSWADFMLANSSLDLVPMLAHGAAMVYIDGLGANPATSMTVPVEDIPIARQQCFQKLSDLSNVDATKILSSPLRVDLGSDSLSVGQFGIKCIPGLSKDPGFAFDAPTTCRNAMRVVRAMQVDKPILLEGDPGVGKTTLIAALARATGHSLTRINLSDQTDLMDLFGSDVPLEGESAGSFSWRDGPFLRAMQAGEWVLLDEMNLASQSVLEGLNACLDHRKQVYITELDQTFRRHPKFVLFAAQNPHSQGGGRKGLPASFVNRFTVVYADALQENDLRIIAIRTYPQLPDQDIEKVISIIREVADMLHHNSRIGSVGGPWDVNLRDIYRWLQLCTRANNFIDPVHFATLILSQRFRTEEQRRAVGSVITSVFGDKSLERSLFHNMSTTIVQVGLVVAHRGQKFADIEATNLTMDPAFLQVYETLLICVEKNWPAILAGSSGCGAKIVEFTLNGDTDSMDLVGGFEQIDSHRSISFYLDHLTGKLREHCAELLESGDDGALEAVTSLIHFLSARPRDLTAALEQLNALAEVFPIYVQEAISLEHLITSSQESERPSFAWTDGILVQAMEHGSWVVLNNANLCNPSILDRLNSLMEPNGRLEINEQHKADGSPRVVVPHANFRVFLTMDPKYGELSKAMRNRCVEIYMEPFQNKSDQGRFVPSYKDESNIARLRLMDKTLPSPNDDRANFPEQVVLDHLSPSDISTLSGVSSISLRIPSETIAIFKLYYVESAAISTFMEATNQILAGIGSMPQIAEPVHPLVNEPLLSLLSDEVRSSSVYKGGLADLFITIGKVLANFNIVKNAALQKPVSQLNGLERSIVAERLPGQGNKAISQLAQFLSHVLTETARWIVHLARGRATTNVDCASVSIPSELVFFLVDLFDMANASNIDSSVFQIYLQVGTEIAQRLESFDAEIGLTLVKSLQIFDADWNLKFGRSLGRMWSSWKPWTPATEDQLNSLLQLQSLVARLDNITNSLRIPIDQLGQLRASLRKSMNLQLSSGCNVTDLLKEVEQKIISLEHSVDSEMSPRSIIFQSEFETLAQFLDLGELCDNDIVTESLQDIIAILARRPTSLIKATRNSGPSSVLDTLSSYSGQMAATAPLAVTRNFSFGVAGQLAKFATLPLFDVSSAQISLEMMLCSLAESTAILAVDQFSYLKKMCFLLVLDILSCHEDLLAPEIAATVSQREGLNLANAISKSKDSYDILLPDVSGDHYFRYILDRLLLPELKSLVGNDNNAASIGRALFAVSLAILRLFVPDRPFDPALKIIVSRNRHAKRTSELQAKLKALIDFELVFTGQNNNYRSRLIQMELDRLGGQPPAPPVVRLSSADLQAVQAEFNVIIQTILSKQLENLLLADISEHQLLLEIRTLQQNISQIIPRLSSCPPSYADLTTPIIRSLQSLSFAADVLSFAVPSSPETEGVDELIKDVCLHTPLMGGSPGVEDIAADVSFPATSGTLSPPLEFIRRHAYLRAKVTSSDHKVIRTEQLLHAFQSLYNGWKTELTSQQEDEEKKSRYYDYRGGDDDEEVDEADMLQLFPKYDASTDSQPQQKDSKYEPRLMAIKLAKLHARMNDLNVPDFDLQPYVMSFLDEIGALPNCTNRRTNLMDPKLLFPALFLRLAQELEGPSLQAQGPVLDFYRDGNDFQTRTLIELVQNIKVRFKNIRAHWPEHVTPHDVLKCCSEVLSFSKSDPLAKIITKVEQLHSFLNEWQTIASREYSVEEFLRRITDLLIEWRKLELLSWPHLLQTERQKMEDEASSWWFITFEVLVMIPMQIVQTRGDMPAHCTELADTLTKFLQTTSQGQFCARLNLLRHFCGFLTDLKESIPELLPTRNTLENVLEHFERFRDQVNNIVEDGTVKFENNIKEQIQLASWKDTNVAALRDSARRSHHRLFKIVRKYRAFLEQPLELPAIPPSEFPSMTDLVKHKPVDMNSVEEEQTATLLSLALHNWHEKPERLRRPVSAAKTMQRLYENLALDQEPHIAIQSFSESIFSSMALLKKETPSTLTEDNKNFVQHLKSRKRKLLADTLRDVRQMGVSRNLSTEELDRQKSLSLVLATTPARQMKISSPAFHAFLDILPNIHRAVVDYSEDLTGSEVGRSVGSLQGLLYMMRHQRADLIPAMAEFDSLSTIKMQLQELSKVSTSDLRCLKPEDANLISSLDGRLHCLVSILKVGCRVIEIQSKHGRNPFNRVLQGLRDYHISLSEHEQRIESLTPLPLPLVSAKAEAIYQDADAEMHALRASLAQWTSDEPRLSYLLDQIISWTARDTASTVQEEGNDVAVDLRQIDEGITAAADSVFVALQRLSAASKPAIANQEAGWLQKADLHFRASIKALAIPAVTSSLQDALRRLACCSNLDRHVLTVGARLISFYLPIFEQYHSICEHVLHRYSTLHSELCSMSYTLSKSFISLATDGFCTPAEPGANQEKSGKVESGTGLGDGEGAEDISKDIADDEDLSELAHQENERQEGETDAAEDAVDMETEDLEGTMDDSGEAQDNQSGDERSGGDEDEDGDMDEEAGSVDNLDPSAVDEKLWDGLGKEEQKELEDDQAKGQADQNETTANENRNAQTEAQEDKEEAATSGDEDEASDPDDEGEAVGREEVDKTDPHLQQEEGMELPDEMQLDGEKGGDDSSISDEDFDKLSDVEEPSAQPDNLESPSNQEERNEDAQQDTDDGEAEEANLPAEDELMEEAMADDDTEDEDHLRREDDAETEQADNTAAESGAGAEADGNIDKEHSKKAQDPSETIDNTDMAERESKSAEDSGTAKQDRVGKKDVMDDGAQQTAESSEQQVEAFKKLGDVLERWHKQQREIMQASENDDQETGQVNETEMTDADFEHLRNEEDMADTQALGSATKDQARALDQSQAIEDKDLAANEDAQPPDVNESDELPDAIDELHPPEMSTDDLKGQESQSTSGAFVPKAGSGTLPQVDSSTVAEEISSEQIPDISATTLDAKELPALTDPEQASRLWQHYSSITHALSLGLTENLRLILSPTLASKLRGDFRTGKRLNIKRIIPYIASNYKRDKIWLRRSIPSKRNYQILLAVDDSKSMAESGSGFLALETVALLCKSLSMLEVGEISVVSFGSEEHIRVAHPFGIPFTNDIGPKVFQNFSYAQNGTNVRRLVEDSISIFRDARNKNIGSNAADLWQLMTIISDGICEDHDGIRRLVRQAKEERIMIVFVIVDAQLKTSVNSSTDTAGDNTANAAYKRPSAENTSILDLTSASFEADPLNDGEMKLKIKRYLEGFPFPYYLIVRNVRELPAVLSTALKGWFQEVVKKIKQEYVVSLHV